MIDDQRSQAFWKLAEKQAAAIQSSSHKPNDKSKEYFGLDGELINRLRPDLEKQYAGIWNAQGLISQSLERQLDDIPEAP